MYKMIVVVKLSDQKNFGKKYSRWTTSIMGFTSVPCDTSYICAEQWIPLDT